MFLSLAWASAYLENEVQRGRLVGLVINRRTKLYATSGRCKRKDTGSMNITGPMLAEILGSRRSWAATTLPYLHMGNINNLSSNRTMALTSERPRRNFPIRVKTICDEFPRTFPLST